MFEFPFIATNLHRKWSRRKEMQWHLLFPNYFSAYLTTLCQPETHILDQVEPELDERLLFMQKSRNNLLLRAICGFTQLSKGL
jgi:hypothetical protein